MRDAWQFSNPDLRTSDSFFTMPIKQKNL
jgi:hypothetical protein